MKKRIKELVEVDELPVLHHPRYEVIWRDSRLYISQTSEDEKYAVCIITSVGYKIRDDKVAIVLAGDIVDGEYRRVTVIPRENIISTENL